MAVYLGKNKIGITKYENLDTELGEQEELLNDLEADVNALEDKPKSDLQRMIDETNSCLYLFYPFTGASLDFITTKLDTRNVTNMNSMFRNCEELTSLDLSSFDTSKVTSLKAMFYYCKALTSLDLSNFNTRSAIDMSDMFYFCSSLTSLDISSFDTSNVTSMSSMFYSCQKLTELDLSSFDTGKVTAMNNMFQGCTELITINGEIDMIKIQTVSSMFNLCPNLTNITLKNIQKAITLGSGTSYGTLLSNDSLINTIQELWDLTGSTSKTLTLSTTSKNNIANIYVKLITPTAEQIEADPYINNKKPCEVCEPTDEGAMLITEYLISKNWALA